MKKAIFFIVFFVSQALGQSVQWIQTSGPTGGSPSITCFLSQDSILIGSNTGLHLTTNRGINWKRTSALEIDPLCITNKSTVLASQTYVLFRSTDRGATWKTDTIGGTPPKGSYSPPIRDESYVSPEGYIYFTRGNGIYRSTDDGINWKIVGPAGETRDMFYMDPKGKLYRDQRDSGIVYSSNSGTIWKKLTNSKSTEGRQCFSMVSYKDHFFVSSGNGMCVSTNNGTTWRFDTLLNFSQLAVNSKGVVFAKSGTKLYRTTNLGKSWDGLSFPPYSHEVWKIRISPNDEVFISTTYDGVIKSTDNGDTWVEMNEGFINSSVTDLFMDKDKNLYACAGKRGLYTSSNNGGSWDRIPSPRVLCSVDKGLVLTNGMLFIVTDSGMFQTSDHGTTWSKNDPDWSKNDPISGISSTYSILKKGPNDQLYLSHMYKFYRSSDFGSSWSQINDISSYIGGLESIAKDSVGKTWFVSYDTLYYSNDSGLSWSPVAFDADLDYSQTRRMIVDTGNKYFVLCAFGLFSSDDEMKNWTQLDTDHYSSPSVNELYMNSFGHLFLCSTDNGIKRSFDKGANWHHIDTGLPPTTMMSVLLGENDFLYAGNRWSGVYRTLKSTNAVKPITKAIAPFKYYYDRQSSILKINILNSISDGPVFDVVSISGSEVSDLVSGPFMNSSNSYEYNCSRLSSGVYFIKASIDGSITYSPLLIVR